MTWTVDLSVAFTVPCLSLRLPQCQAGVRGRESQGERVTSFKPSSEALSWRSLIVLIILKSLKELEMTHRISTSSDNLKLCPSRQIILIPHKKNEAT